MKCVILNLILDLKKLARKDILVDNQRNSNVNYSIKQYCTNINFLGMIMMYLGNRMFMFLRDVGNELS